MGVAFRKLAGGFTSGSGPITTASFTATAGDAVIATVRNSTENNNPLTLTGTGTYTLQASPGQFNDPNNHDTYAMFANLSATSGAQTLTGDSSPTGSFCRLWAYEYSDVASAASTLTLVTGTGGNISAPSVYVPTGSVLVTTCFTWNADSLPVSGGGGTSRETDSASFVTIEFAGANAFITPTFTAASAVDYYIVMQWLLQPLLPIINTQPANVSAANGSTESFTVSATASGGSLSYQWYKASPSNGLYSNSPGTFSSISGATSATYTTGTLSSSDNGNWFYCAVTDANGTVNTRTVRGWVAGLASAGKGNQLKSSWPQEFKQCEFSHTVDIGKKSQQFGYADQIGYQLFSTFLLGSQATSASGSAAVAEGTDTVAGAGSTSTSGSAALTEGHDTVAGVGVASTSGSAALTEGADTVSGAGSGARVGAAAATEGGDTVAGAGSTSTSGSASATEGGDVVAGAGATSTSGSAAVAEGADAVAGVGSAGASGAAAITEGSDTVSGAGSTSTSGSAAATEGADTVAGAGATSTSGSAAIAEGADTVSGVGAAGAAGIGTVQEGADTASGAGSTSTSGSAAVQEGADTVSGSGSTSTSGSAAATEGADTSAGSGAGGAVGITAYTEGADTVAGSGSTSTTGAGAVAEGGDTGSGSGATSTSGSAAVAEGHDTASGAGAASLVGTSADQEQSDAVSGTGSTSTTGAAAAAEQPDTVSGSGSGLPPAQGVGAATEAADTAQGSGAASLTGAASITESPDAAKAIIKQVYASGDHLFVAQHQHRIIFAPHANRLFKARRSQTSVIH